MNKLFLIAIKLKKVNKNLFFTYFIANFKNVIKYH